MQIVQNGGVCIDACLSDDVTCSFWLQNKSFSLDIRSTESTITLVKKHAEMSVKNDVSGGVKQISIHNYYVNMPKSTQSCNG